jgi:hypothetical protein
VSLHDGGSPASIAMASMRLLVMLGAIFATTPPATVAAAAAGGASAQPWQRQQRRGERGSSSSSTCPSGDRQEGVCFSTSPTRATSMHPPAINATTPDECCAACLRDRLCYAWTFNEKHHPTRCQLKNLLYPNSTRSPACTSGNVKAALPVSPPPVPPPLPPPSDAKSVLFLIVDDLRPQLGLFGAALPATPHLDRLASRAMRFDYAYVQYAFCAPSRNSFMSGRRPDTTRVWQFLDHFREVGVGHDWLSLPGYFKFHG